jgi:putative transcriptional regulator
MKRRVIVRTQVAPEPHQADWKWFVRCHRKILFMSSDFALTNLTHHFLIAMPGLEDDVFARSVVYLCEHSDRGALGLVINKPSDISLRNLFDKVELPLRRDDLMDTPVLQGGPVQTDRGFVLHEAVFADADPVYASTMTIPGGLEMTTSKDVLEALSSGAGPRKVLVTLGYAAWGEGQLESEIGENFWLTVAADLGVIFDTPVAERYDKALGLLGMQAWMLSTEAGHA